MASIRTGQDERQGEGPDRTPDKQTYHEDQEFVAHGIVRTISKFMVNSFIRPPESACDGSVSAPLGNVGDAAYCRRSSSKMRVSTC